MKPWLKEEGGHQLEGFVGAWGIKTSQFNSIDCLLQFTEWLFDLPSIPANVKTAALEVEGLGKRKRKMLAKAKVRC